MTWIICFFVGLGVLAAGLGAILFICVALTKLSEYISDYWYARDWPSMHYKTRQKIATTIATIILLVLAAFVVGMIIVVGCEIASAAGWIDYCPTCSVE